MIEFTIKINADQRVAYIPQELFAILGCRAKAVSLGFAVLIFPENVSKKNLLKSLELIKASLMLDQEVERINKK